MNIVKFEEVENKIIIVRNEKVILDSDLAVLYDVETRDINKAVKNNPEKFPDAYIFELSKNEKKELVENFHHLNHLKFSSVNPKAFTEKGLYMLATILKSPIATQTTISIIEAYSKIKSLTSNINEISVVKEENQKKSLIQKSGEILAELLSDDLHIDQSETTIELNFALIKLKHTLKRK